MAAELLRRGAYVELDLGGHSDPDVIAYSRDRTRTVQIKVKAKGIRSKQVPGWQWNLKHARQARDAPGNKYLVLVDLAPVQPDYYICQLNLIAQRVLRNHKDFLNRHRGSRPRTPESQHTLIPLEAVYKGREAWEQLDVLGKY
ncbi:MAG: hypothetical protein OXI24_07525 [Candidatus Poribacteria bacterium]|nr:hypothetical protein [Candidatus Poribacteria bacterium]